MIQSPLFLLNSEYYRMSKTSFLLLFWTVFYAVDLVAQQKSYEHTLPLMEATQFAPGDISTQEFEINAVFNRTGESVIFARCDAKFTHCVMMESVYKDGVWQPSSKLPFSGQFHEADPYYSADYSTLYFISQRPVPGSTEPSESFNLWSVKKTLTGWAEPQFMPQLSSNKHELYPSVTDDGTLYYVSFKNDQRHIYESKLESGVYKSDHALPEHIYGPEAYVGDSVISRNGQVLIMSISGRQDSLGKADLYVSRLLDGKWTVAESLGSKVNTANHEFTPIISPDGKYLFFTRIDNGVGNLYQIDLSTLNISLEMSEPGQMQYRQQALNALEMGQTLAGIKLDAEWKTSLYRLVANTMQHPAWGMGHYERNYLITLALAKQEKIEIDKDVLFAASFLHDMATFKPWSKAGMDHASRASEIVPVILEDIGFETAKINAVQELIQGHMFAAVPVEKPLAQLFHDADTLDFIGVTGITRILSLNGSSGWASNTETALKTLQGFSQTLPEKLISQSAKNLAKQEIDDMRHFLQQIEQATQGFKAP